MIKLRVCFLLLLCCQYCGAEPIKIGMEINPNPPYVMSEGEKNVEYPGLYLELLERAAANLNIELEFVARPWKRVLAEVENGKLDAALGSSYTSERAVYGLYPQVRGEIDASKRIGVRAYFIYQKKDAQILWDGKKFELEGKTFGVMRSYAIVSELKQLGMNLMEVSSQKRMLAMLERGRVDAIIDLGSYIDHQLNQSPKLAEGIIKVYPAVRQKPYYLMFSKSFAKDNMNRVNSLWGEIEKNRESESYKKLQRQYLSMLASQYQ